MKNFSLFLCTLALYSFAVSAKEYNPGEIKPCQHDSTLMCDLAGTPATGKTKDGVNYVDGKREGHFKFYHQNGNLQWEITYKNNQPEGISRMYYESGALQDETTYKDGKMDGPMKAYYESGQLKIVGNNKDGLLDGDFKYYYETGELLGERTFKAGKPDGDFKFYYKNGKVSHDGKFEDNGTSVVVRAYRKDGNLKGKVTIKNGELVSAYSYTREGKKKNITKKVKNSPEELAKMIPADLY